MKAILSTAILASATLALFSVSAQAATTVYNAGDLFIGFHATGGTGATTDYLVDLGSATQIEGGANVTFNVGNLNADLTSIYGSGYATRSDLQVGLIGASGDSFGDVDPLSADPDNTLFVGKKHGATVPTRGTGSAQSVVESKLGDLGSAYDSHTSTANSAFAITQATGSANSYASYQLPNGSPSTNSFGLGYSVESDLSGGLTNLVLDVYKLVPTTGGGNGTLLGTLTFPGASASPVFTAAGAAVPETATLWAALPLIGLLGFARRRMVRA